MVFYRKGLRLSTPGSLAGWRTLANPDYSSGTAEDPTGNSYGWGYTGKSGGGEAAEWIHEQVDISQFAGEEVYLRFEYITDTGVNWHGDRQVPFTQAQVAAALAHRHKPGPLQRPHHFTGL